MLQPGRYISNSGSPQTNCAQVTLAEFYGDPDHQAVAVADDKDWTQAPVLFTPEAWNAFTAQVAAGGIPSHQIRHLAFDPDEWDVFVQGVRDGKFAIELLSA